MQKLLVAAIVVMPLFASAADSGPKPGRYEVVSKQGDDPQKTAFHCLTAAEVAKGLETPAAPGCKVQQSGLNGGKFSMLMSCPDMTSSVVGTYTATSYTMEGKMHAKLGGQVMDIVSHATAKRVGDSCKPTDE